MNFSCIVLISLACLVISSYASPIQVVEAHPANSKSDLTLTNALVGRQTAPAAPAPVAAATDDDDDDDEEDDIEDALDDDDGNQYFAGFFNRPIEIMLTFLSLNQMMTRKKVVLLMKMTMKTMITWNDSLTIS